MSNLFRITFLIGLMQLACIPSAFAVTKLSSFMESAEAYATTAKDYLETGEAIVNEVQTTYNQIKMLAESGELAAYVQKEATDYAKDYAKKEGEKYADKAKKYGQEKLDKYKEKRERKKLEKKADELAAKQAEIEEYEDAMDDEVKQKYQQINERLTELRAQIQRKDLKKEDFEKIREEIADLEAQQQAVLDKPKEHDETLQGKKEEEEKITKELEEAKKEVETAEAEENLQEKSVDLFTGDPSNEENQSIYQTEIEALFLKENEESTSENLARIKRNRNLEYYNAIQNAMNVALANGSRSVETEEQNDNNLDMGSNVEGNLALKNVNVSAVIEKAKAASHLTETLLAEMRLKTTQDMVSWNNKNRLYDYKKPVTEFDIDYYELKKTDLKSSKLKSLFEAGKGAAKDLYDQNKNDVKNLWHKL